MARLRIQVFKAPRCFQHCLVDSSGARAPRVIARHASDIRVLVPKCSHDIRTIGQHHSAFLERSANGYRLVVQKLCPNRLVMPGSRHVVCDLKGRSLSWKWKRGIKQNGPAATWSRFLKVTTQQHFNSPYTNPQGDRVKIGTRRPSP